MYIIDMAYVSSVKKQSINKSFKEATKTFHLPSAPV